LDAQAETGVRAQDFSISDKPTPIDPPPRPDPTGEQAISGDRARQLRGELDQAESRIVDTIRLLRSGTRDIHQAIHVVILLDSYGPRPTSKPQREAIRELDNAAQTIHRITVEVLDARKPDAATLAKISNGNAPVCAFCADAPPCTADKTTVSANLTEPRWVCRSCYDRIRGTGKPPSRRDLEHLKSHGRWPRLKEQAA